MHIQVGHHTGLSIEDLFENALKRISVQAFDALLTCGVGDVDGLLRLSEEDYCQYTIPSNVSSELIAVQGLINDRITKFDKGVDVSKHIDDKSEYETDQCRECCEDNCSPNHSDRTISSPIKISSCPTVDSRLPRVRCLSVESEYSPSTPADWSILSKSLPHLFGVAFPFNYIYSSDNAPTISTLGLPATELCHLRNIVLFPEVYYYACQ